MNLHDQARAAVKAARDFAPAGEHYTEVEVATLTQLCRDAYVACQAAGTSIGAIRLELYCEEREEHRQELERICAEFRAAALARAGRETR